MGWSIAPGTELTSTSASRRPSREGGLSRSEYLLDVTFGGEVIGAWNGDGRGRR